MTSLVAVWLQLGGTVPVVLMAAGLVFTAGVAVFLWRRLMQMEDRPQVRATWPATQSKTENSR